MRRRLRPPRQHRHVGGGVVVPVADGQRPEVGRGPVEDHARTAPPAPSRAMPVTALQPISTGTAPGRPADHDVAGRGALEPERVHEHVEEAGGDGQHGAEQVDRGPQQERRPRPRGRWRRSGRPAGDMTPVTSGRSLVRSISRSMSRSTYMLMALAPPAASVPADHGAGHEPERRQAPLGHDHRGHRGDEQQLDDPRLRERDVGPDPGAERQPVADTAAG